MSNTPQNTTPSPSTPRLTLALPGFAYADLYDPARLAELLKMFDATVKSGDATLYAEWQSYCASQ